MEQRIKGGKGGSDMRGRKRCSVQERSRYAFKYAIALVKLYSTARLLLDQHAIQYNTGEHLLSC